MHRCFEQVWRRICLLISGVLVVLFAAILVNVITTSDQIVPLRTVITTALNTPVQMDVYGDRTVRIHQPERTKRNPLNHIVVHKYLNIFNASYDDAEEGNSIITNSCVPLLTTMGSTPICIYDTGNDWFVSGTVNRSGMWEKRYVYLMAELLAKNPDMQLLDIGSNIGVYSLQAAKMGRKVIAVDANKLNIRLLAKSLYLGDLQQNVTLVWNAITDIHETVSLTITMGNIGASFVKSADVSQHAVNQNTALAITLEDLVGFLKGNPVFMKIDIERSEWKAFRGGEIFFQEVDVRYIMMEWWSYKQEESNGRDVIKYMTRFGFEPYEIKMPLETKLDIKKPATWPIDIMWMKE